MFKDVVLPINISQTATPEYTAWFPTYSDDVGDAASVNFVVDLDSEVGTASLVITPQVSVDNGENIIDRGSLPALTAVGQTEGRVGRPLRYMRFKLVLTGSSSPAFVGTIKATPSLRLLDTIDTLVTGVTNVTTAGTRVVLATAQIVRSVTIKAKSTNTGKIYVGDVTVAAANGFPLDAGESVSFELNNLASIYIDSAVNGEGVSYLAVK